MSRLYKHQTKKKIQKTDAFYPHSTDLMKSQKANSHRLQQIVTTRQNSIMALRPE